MHIAIHCKTLAEALVDTLAYIVGVTEARTLRYSPRDLDVKALVDRRFHGSREGKPGLIIANH